jgi:hypothetical protein
MARPRSNTASPQAAELPGLQLHHAAARIQVLLRERSRLVRDAQKKQEQLEQLEQRISRDAQEMAANMTPLLERHRLLVAELTALFNELLAPGRLSKRARSHINQIRRSLEFQGVLSAIDDGADAGPADDEMDDPWEDRAPDDGDGTGSFGKGGRVPPRHRQPSRGGDQGHGAHAPHAETREVAGARQVGQEKRSLRDLFRNLARSIHPDKARHEAERAERNEVMKQVTRAYEDGDLARLVELESAWNEQLAATGAEDPEARCRALERVNRELLDQVRQLTRAIRDLKRDAQQAFQGASPAEIVAGATQELDELQAMCELLRQFRDGQITLAELKRRTMPPPPSPDELDLLEALMLQEMGLWPPPSRRDRPRRHERK